MTKREHPDQLTFSFGSANAGDPTDSREADRGRAPSVPSVTKTMPADQSSRDVIRTELDTSLMVLAGAGAGKTYELVERMVATLAEERAEPIRIRNIAAITFTRKAAGELRTRFYDRLQRAARESETGVQSRLQEAASQIDQCFIGTIHAFCSRLLRERPLEAGLPFDFKELDERDEPRARRRAWTEFTNQRLRAADPRLERLLEIGFSSEVLYKFFSRRNEFPELALKPTDIEEPDLSEAVALVSALVARSGALLKDEARTNPKKWERAIVDAQLFLEKRAFGSNADRAEFLALFDSTSLKKNGVAVTKYHDKAFAYELRDQLVPQLKEEVVDPAFRRWKQYVYGLMASLVDEAVDFYDQKRRQAGTVTFSDLLVKTALMLRDNPSVRRYFQRRYQRILVDEFQDTDPVQAEILFYLSGAETEQRDWRRLTPLPGSLFVVGDEKQSIYRFRRADVDTFRFVQQRIGETGGQIVSLNTSFRSLGRLCDWFNGSFEQILGAEDRAFQAPWGPLLRFRPDGSDPVCVRTISHPKAEGGRVPIVLQDATRIADFIAAARLGQTEFNGSEEGAALPPKPSFGSFMILTWTSKYVDLYAQALEARGIPYDLVGGGHLGDSLELQVVTQLLEAIADPNDPTTLVGYLRGPLVGLGDDDLLAIRKAVGRFNVDTTDFGDLDFDLQRQLDNAYSFLKEARAELTTQSPASAIEKVLHDSGLIPWTAGSTDLMGSSRAGNLIRLLANVRRWQRQGLHWVDMVHEMRALIEDAEYQIQGLTLEAGESDAVRIMNLHQAKGLEGDVVFLADPTGLGYEGPPDFHVSRLEDEYLSMAVQSPKGWGYKTQAEPVGWEEDEEREKKYLQAEDTRLRYVAATRARNLLIVSVAEERKKGPWFALNQFLKDAPELEKYPAAVAPALRSDPTTFEEHGERRVEAWRAIRNPSWDVATPSIEGEDHTLFLSGERRGADYGSAVHQLFDELIAGRVTDVRSYLEQTTKLDQGAFEAAIAAADAFRESKIWSEIEASDDVFSEAPFGGVVSGTTPTLVRGRIDLIYRTGSGWKIIDFKTDAARTELEVNALLDHYREQVAAYATYWTEITGEPVVEKGLWLTSLNRFVPVD